MSGHRNTLTIEQLNSSNQICLQFGQRQGGPLFSNALRRAQISVVDLLLFTRHVEQVEEEADFGTIICNEVID